MRSDSPTPIVEYDRRFKLFGSHVRVLIGAPTRAGLPSPEAMGIQIEFFLRLLHRKLTRFDRNSELSALNADPGEHCPVSPTLALAVEAALWAARTSEGLVDPTLVGELERAGYASSRADPNPLRSKMRLPSRRSAGPLPLGGRRPGDISVDSVAGIVSRPVVSASTPAAAARGSRPIWPPTGWTATRPLQSTPAVIFGSVASGRQPGSFASIIRFGMRPPTS